MKGLLGTALFAALLAVPSGAVLAQDHSTPAAITKDYEDFTAVYKDIAGLFTADDFRTPGEKKFLEKEKVKLDGVDATKFIPLKRKLDKLQQRMRSLLLLNAVRASEKQFSRIYALGQRAARALELPGPFNLFILGDRAFNAFTYSYNAQDFDVVLNAGLVENLTDDEILAILGHEMGHVKDQVILTGTIMATSFETTNKNAAPAVHTAFYDAVYHDLPAKLRTQLAQIAMETAAEGLVVSALSDEDATEFGRQAESTADRAAVIVTGDEKAGLRALAMIAYGTKALAPEFNLDELIQQISAVLAANGEDEDIQFLLDRQGGHPFDVVRLVQVRDWAASKTFAKLKARLEQSSFGKELDLYKSLTTRAGELEESLKKYRLGGAETDDTIVRLRTESGYTAQINRLTGAVSVLGQLLTAQLEGSGLAKADNALWTQLMDKLKADNENHLKNSLVPGLIELLKGKVKNATGDEVKELQKKLDALKDVQELK